MLFRSLLFVKNNAPTLDTASDICRIVGISKALVARSVRMLCQKGLLLETRDERDRRQVHLSLTEKCAPLGACIEQTQHGFQQKLLDGVCEDDLAAAQRVFAQMSQNAAQISQSIINGEEEQ